MKAFCISFSHFIICLHSSYRAECQASSHPPKKRILQPSLMIQIFFFIDTHTHTSKRGEKIPTDYLLCKKSFLKCRRTPCFQYFSPSAILCPRASDCLVVSDNINLFQVGMSQTLMWTCSGTSEKED